MADIISGLVFTHIVVFHAPGTDITEVVTFPDCHPLTLLATGRRPESQADQLIQSH
jgi:molybdopterin-binding protein